MVAGYRYQLSPSDRDITKLIVGADPSIRGARAALFTVYGASLNVFLASKANGMSASADAVMTKSRWRNRPFARGGRSGIRGPRRRRA